MADESGGRLQPVAEPHTSNQTTSQLAGQSKGTRHCAREIHTPVSSEQILQTLEQHHRILHSATPFNLLRKQALECIRDALCCEQAWLLSPKDTSLKFWKVDQHSSQEGIPAKGLSYADGPVSAELANAFRCALNAQQALTPDVLPGQLIMALRTDRKSSLLILKQTAECCDWQPESIRLFQLLGRQLEEALGAHSTQQSLSYRDAELNNLISDRVQSTQELLHLRNLLGSTIDAMPSALIGIDLQHRISQWNRETEILTGIPRATALGLALFEVFPQLPLSQRQLKKTVHSRQVESLTRICWDYRGKQRVIDLTIYPICGREIDGAVIRLDDISERVNMEETMVQHAKMLSLGGLAAGIAHEVNNPLSGIMQNLHILRNRLSINLDKNHLVAEDCGTDMGTINQYLEDRELHQLINSTADSAQRAAEIVANMLNFSRKDDVKPQPSDLRQLLDATLELAASGYNHKHKGHFRTLQIKRDFAANLPLVLCQRSKIQQVFLNLLNNGAQAMHGRVKHGEEQQPDPKTEPPVFTLRLINCGASVRCEIEDNGPGMDEETCQRAFEPFYTTKPSENGTGLGLAISYAIICTHHQGSMRVESTPGVGTRFIIELPAATSISE